MMVDDPVTEAETTAIAGSDATTAIAAGTTATAATTTAANSFIQLATQAWQAAVDSIGKAAQSQINGFIANNNNANARMNAVAANAMAVGQKYQLPSDYSACNTVKGEAAADEIRTETRVVARALAMGGSQQHADPSSIAADIAAARATGLAPCTPSQSGADTRLSAYQALKCTQKYGGAWEGADTTMQALFTYEQFPVPTDFVKPIPGVPQPIKPATSEKYMPFLAAYSYCRKIGARVPPAPQMKNGLTLEGQSMAAYDTMVATATAAYAVCMDMLSERMQYGQGMGDIAYQQNHTSQVTKCQTDAIKGVIDGDPQYIFAGNGNTGTCSSDGRSKLQGEYDMAHRDSAKGYYGIYTKGLTPDALSADLASVAREKIMFEERIDRERDTLMRAIDTANAAARVVTSQLSLPVNNP
jgi:hypothetical protein